MKDWTRLIRTLSYIAVFGIMATYLGSCSPGPSLQSISVTPGSTSIAKGLQQQFMATGTYSNNTTKDLTTSVTWSSSAMDVATISAAGLASTVGTGSTTIQASMRGVTGSTGFAVSPPVIASINVGPAIGSTAPAVASALTIPQGLPEQFLATGVFTDQSTQDVTQTATWSSTAVTFATVTPTGVVEGVGAGPATIQASVGNVQGSVNLTVTSAALSELVVTPQDPSIADAGATQNFAATGYFTDGSSMDLTALASWQSTNSQAASVTTGGVATSATLPANQTVAFTSIQATEAGFNGVSILTVTNHTGSGFAGVFTQRNDNQRTGQNLSETALTTSNVNSTTFGKLFSQPVDGQIYAQPLYVPNVTIAGQAHNVMYVATQNESIFAFDADSNTGTNAAPLWQANLIDTAHGAAAGAVPVNSVTGISCNAIVPQVGITSTPVIDPSTNTLYAETVSYENKVYIHRLHAIDLATGNEKPGAPAVISGSVTGTGDGSENGTLTFNPRFHMNRPGLLLLNGVVYVGFASYCDVAPFHGWLFAYDATSLSQRAIYVVTPDGSDGGLWNSGTGISADINANIYLATANGTFDTTNIPATQLGDSIVKILLNGTSINMLDYFTPYNQSADDTGDLDLGAGGVLVLPDQPGANTHQLVVAAKGRVIYEVNRDQMTAGNLHYCSANCNSTDAQIIYEFRPGGDSWSTPAYWNGNVYYWGSGGELSQFALTNGMLSSTPVSKCGYLMQFPGSNPAISANGTSNAIVWAIDATQYGNNGATPGPAVLHAFNATNLANELYNTSQAAAGRDTAGAAVKFTVPTIANGKVYIGTQTEMDVYGLLP